VKSRISGKDATYVAREALKRRPDPGCRTESMLGCIRAAGRLGTPRRKREAAAALKAMGVGKPTCNEMKDGPGHGQGGPKKICDQPPNAYGP
jgi:hypothetical protein